MLSKVEAPAPENSPVRDSVGSLGPFLRTLRKSLAVIVALIMLSAGASLLYSKSVARVYQSTAMIEFDPRAIRPLADKAQALQSTEAYWDNREYYDTQLKIVTSDHVLTRVARDLGLLHDQSFENLVTPPAQLTLEDIAVEMRKRLSVEPVKGTRLALIQYEDTDPQRARRICQSIADVFVGQNLEKTISATSDAVIWLNGQVDHYKTELNANENALHEFKNSNELSSTSINDASNMIRLEMQEFDTALTHTRTKKQELLARHKELSAVSDGDPAQLPASELLSNTFLQQIRAQYLEAVRERESLLAEGKGDNHPMVKRAAERASETRRALLDEVRNIKGAVERDLAVVIREEAGEEGLYEAARRKAIDLNMKEIEFHRLDRSRGENEKVYEMLLERMKEADLARMMNVNDVRVVDSPIEAKKPIRPRVAINVSAGLLAGLVLGIAFAVLRELFDNTLKTPADVEQGLGVTFLGLLPEIEEGHGKKKKKSRRGTQRPPNGQGRSELTVHDDPRGALAEAARTVRTNLLFTNPDKPFRTMLVTSAAPAEGKTTVACSIAIAMAQGGQRVCIVDCDLRRPRLHRIFGRPGDSGVTNVLVGEATIADVVKVTMVENLWCIPAGPIPPNPADIFHSERFRRFLLDLGEQFDRVIIDSPPLAAVTDGAIISTLVDGTVFVIRAFKTTRALSRQGLRALADVDVPVIGAVLNAVDFNKHEYKYYQYYYYKREGYAPAAPTMQADEGERAQPPN